MIDVVVPVYRGLQQTRACVESVLASPRSPQFELVVIDDASPEPALAEYVAGLARDSGAHVVRHETNRGFIHSVNAGMSLHRDRDVVLLNSDAEVANDWLARLHAAAHCAPKVATVTPFSNNATICSYPFWGWSGGVPGTLGLAALDALVARANAGVRIDIPTAVGFCMYIRRDALEELGLFDAELFGRGYGEENDFCMRAAKAGWRNLLAADVFVFHEGSVSFSEERFKLMDAAAKTLLAAHPEYTETVHRFVAADGTAALRAAIDRARLAAGIEEVRCVVGERDAERQRIMGELRQANDAAEAARREAALLKTQLASAVAESEARGKLLEESRRTSEGEIVALRQALAHAESLAFSRQRELEEIHSFWMWRYFSFLVRRRRGTT